jgi:pimeloyl-ACP methyl ester carboxylesterase
VPLITGMPPSPGRIVASLVRHPLVTLAVMRLVAGLGPLQKRIRAGDVDSSLRFFTREVLGDEAFERLPEEVRTHMLANASSLLGTVQAGVEGVEPISEDEIRSIKTPTLVVSGAQSPLFNRRLARLLGNLLPNSRSLEVPSATHFMHLQNPRSTPACCASLTISTRETVGIDTRSGSQRPPPAVVPRHRPSRTNERLDARASRLAASPRLWRPPPRTYCRHP